MGSLTEPVGQERSLDEWPLLRPRRDDHPVADWVLHARNALAPGLVRGRLDDLHSSRTKALDSRIAVVGIDPQVEGSVEFGGSVLSR